MVNLITKHITLFSFLYAFSLILTNNNFLAKIICLIMPVIIFFGKKNYKSYLNSYLKWSNLFPIIKGLSVFIPLLIYPNYEYLFSIDNKETKLFTILLAFNILQPALLLGLNSSEKLSKLNGIYLIILALLTPKLFYDDVSKNIIFKKNILWGLSSTVILISTYLFNDFYHEVDWRYPGLYSIIIPTLHSILKKDSSNWLPLRAFSLGLTLFLHVKFPNIQKKISGELNSKIKWSTDDFDLLKFFFSIVELIFIIFLIKKGYKNTFLEYLL